jgi:hypothetical protein
MSETAPPAAPAADAVSPAAPPAPEAAVDTTPAVATPASEVVKGGAVTDDALHEAVRTLVCNR